MKEQNTQPKNVSLTERSAQFPSSVDFMLLGNCDLRCNFCFGPQHEMSPIETTQAIDVINRLALNGVQRVVFTGGEPALMKDLPEILAAAKDKKLTTVLSTNGILLSSNKELFDKIAPNLDWIALPLEGENPEVNSAMRAGLKGNEGEELFETVLELIPEIRKRYPNLRIKLGTVVAKQNLEHVANIPDLLKTRNAIPDTWKLYQVAPSEYGKINYESLAVSDEEFEKAYLEAYERAQQAGIKNVTKHNNVERPGKHLFINPRGDVLTVDPNTNDYSRIGNILDNFNEVANNWTTYVKKDILNSNFEATYPSR